MEFIILFLMLIVPGFIAAWLFNLISRRRTNLIITGLIFDLLILMNTLFGLRFIKGIPTLTGLAIYFDCLSFLWKYGLLSIFIGVFIAVIFGLIARINPRSIIRRR